MELLGKIFGNDARVKMMRLFLFNEKSSYSLDEVSQRSKVRKDTARRELNQLVKIGFLQAKKKRVPSAASRAKKGTYKRVPAWILNRKFELVEPLKSLLIDTELVHSKDILKRIRKAGNLQLVVLSGIFIKDDHRELDVLVVGENLNSRALKQQIEVLESEIGRELRYASFDTQEFLYRSSMYDKLLRDILENDHTRLVNKLIED